MAASSEPMIPLLVSVTDAAELYGVSRRHMINLLDSGEIGSLKIGRRRMVPYAALVEHINTRLGQAS